MTPEKSVEPLLKPTPRVFEPSWTWPEPSIEPTFRKVGVTPDMRMIAGALVLTRRAVPPRPVLEKSTVPALRMVALPALPPLKKLVREVLMMLALPAVLLLMNWSVKLFVMFALPAVPELNETRLLLMMVALPPKTEIPAPVKIKFMPLSV